MANLLHHRTLTCMPEMAHKTIPPGPRSLASLHMCGSAEIWKSSIPSYMHEPAPKVPVSGMDACPTNSWPSCICTT